MAGLINEQIGADLPLDEAQGMPMPQEQMMEDPAMMEGAMPEEMMAEDMEMEDDNEPLDEDNPVFQSALQFAMSALYENEAAREVAQGLREAPDPVAGLADTAYEIVSIADERLDGEVPDDLIILLAINILQEVAEIGEAAGVDVSPTNVAEAFKQMLLRFLGENGMNTAELEQAMAEVDPSMFNQVAEMEP
jgi:hypothetical protein